MKPPHTERYSDQVLVHYGNVLLYLEMFSSALLLYLSKLLWIQTIQKIPLEWYNVENLSELYKAGPCLDRCRTAHVEKGVRSRSRREESAASLRREMRPGRR